MCGGEEGGQIKFAAERFDLSTFVKCNLGGQSKWLQQLTERKAASNSTSSVLAALTVFSSAAPLNSSLLFSTLLTSSLSYSLLLSPLPIPLLHSTALPAPPPDKAFSTLHCAAAGIRAEIRKTPLEILLPWTALPSTPLHSPHFTPLHSARSGEQRLAPNLVVAANSNVRPAQTLTLSLTRGF